MLHCIVNLYWQYDKKVFMNKQMIQAVAVQLLIVTTGVLIAFEIKRLRDRAKLKPPTEVK